MSFDGARIPLFDAQIERALLGAMLVHERVAAAALDRLSSKDFYRPAHKTIFEVAEILRAVKFSDGLMVYSHLETTGKLESVGGGDYLTSLMMEASGAINGYPNWIDAIREKANLRMLQEALDHAEEALHSGESASAVSSLITTTCSNVGGGLAGVVKAGDVGKRKTALGYSTGIELIDLDTATRGAPRGQMIIVTAAEGVGKSTLMVQIATHAAWELRGCLYTTLADLNAEILRERVLRMACGYSSAERAEGAGKLEAFKRAEYELKNDVALDFDDRTKRVNRDVDDILGTVEAVRVQRMGSNRPLTEVFIDYAQKLTSRHFSPKDDFSMSRYCSTQISNYAEASGLTIYVGSQITEGNKKDGTREMTKGGRHWLEDCGLAIKVEPVENLAFKMTLIKSRFGGRMMTSNVVFDEERLGFKRPGGSF